jgi:5'-3' exonuclease
MSEINTILGLEKKAKIKRGYHLIIDGNFILNKVLHPLHKAKRMDMLYDSLIYAINFYNDKFMFNNIFLVSDKGKSWRSKVYPLYKSKRNDKKNKEIDWAYAHEMYDKAKEYYKNHTSVHVLEKEGIEGDDWIAYLINISNKKNFSTYTISNDRDLLQLLSCSVDNGNEYLNVMVNDMNNTPLMFLPKEYEFFKTYMIENNQYSLFNMNDDTKFIKFIEAQRSNKEIRFVNQLENVITKIVFGDTSDDIESVLYKELNTFDEYGNRKRQGIGETSAKKIAAQYITENTYREYIDIWKDEVCEEIAMFCLEVKKMGNDEKDNVVKRIKENRSIICLDVKHLPQKVIETMRTELKAEMHFKKQLKENLVNGN